MNRETRRTSSALGTVLPLFAVQLASADEGSRPIVDIRFDGPYRQIASSVGDEWAPTWGRDDVLYTGNDDGTSFGGIEDPNTAVAFGKLEGRDPYTLKGTTLSAMTAFREPVTFGPEAAAWQTLVTYAADGVRYRFASCGAKDSLDDDSCLERSTDDSNSWKRIWESKSLALKGRFTAPSFISHGRLEAPLVGTEPGQYVYAASYARVLDGRETYWVGRVPIPKLANSKLADWAFQQADGSWGSLTSAVPFPNSNYLGPDQANWKLMNAYAVDGVLYMFITRCVYPWNSADPKRRHWWLNSSVIKSTDGGKSWTRTGPENYAKPMFPGHRFATPYFVWYGQDGAASVDNAGKYVYAVSNNGFFENGDDYILGRALRARLPGLSAADWSFYKGGDGLNDSSWTASVDGAKPILVNPTHSSMTGMTYIPVLGRYVMAVWHYQKDNFEQAIHAKDLGTVLEFFESGKPWGPWTNVKSFDTGNLGWYTPIIGQRFQKAVDADAVTAVLYATGFASKPEGGLDMTLYKLNYMPITLSSKPLLINDPTYVGGQR